MKRVLVIALGLLLLVEVALRLPPVAAAVGRLVPPPAPVDQPIKEQGVQNDREFIRDPELGNRPAPSRRKLVQTIDFTYTLELDSAGFPNRPPWPERADLAVLGNSLVVGQGVGIDRQFSTLLGKRLGTGPVVDFGLGGAAPEHQVRIYRRYVAAMHPKLVLACLWPASDVTNAFNFARWLSNGRGRDFFEYRTSGGAKVGPGQGPVARLRNLLQRHSRIVSTLGFAVTDWRRAHQPYRTVVRLPAGDTLYLSVRTQEALAAGMRRPGLPALTRVFFDPLVELRTLVEADGGRLVVVLIPSKEELYGAEAFPPVLRAVREVRAGLDSLGFTSVDVYRTVEDGAGPASPFFARDIHLNELGNRLVAEELAEWITAHPGERNPRRVPPGQARDHMRRPDSAAARAPRLR
jgi:hypothetical protein